MTASSFSDGGEAPRDERELPRAGDADERDVLSRRAVAHERVERALDEAVDDEVVEAARDDREARALRDDEVAFDDACRHRIPSLTRAALAPIEWSGTRSTTSSPKPWMPGNLTRVVGQKADLVQAEVGEHLRAEAELAERRVAAGRGPARRAGGERARCAAGVELAPDVAARRDVDERAAPRGLDLRDGFAQVAAAVARRRREGVGDASSPRARGRGRLAAA